MTASTFLFLSVIFVLTFFFPQFLLLNIYFFHISFSLTFLFIFFPFLFFVFIWDENISRRKHKGPLGTAIGLAQSGTACYFFLWFCSLFEWLVFLTLFFFSTLRYHCVCVFHSFFLSFSIVFDPFCWFDIVYSLVSIWTVFACLCMVCACDPDLVVRIEDWTTRKWVNCEGYFLVKACASE